VNDVGDEAGATVPDIKGVFTKYPPNAGDWADPKVEISGWVVVDKPREGDIIAEKLGSGRERGATGHVGIITGIEKTTSAAHDIVKENEWGFRPGQNPTFRRYQGE
jgi:hypothetical protein